jgi:hypothetical protein
MKNADTQESESDSEDSTGMPYTRRVIRSLNLCSGERGEHLQEREPALISTRKGPARVRLNMPPVPISLKVPRVH